MTQVYATIADLAARTSWDEIARRAAEDNRVTGELLRRHVGGEDGGDIAEALALAVARLNQVISDASAEIDSYLTPRVDLPLQHIPPVLRTRAVDLATYSLLGGNRESQEYTLWQAARTWLVDAAAGRVRLDSQAAADTPAVDGAEFAGDAPVMTRQSLRHAGF